MNPSRIFIERPIATSLLMAAILLGGWLAWLFLPLSALPDVQYPTLTVSTFYPGAGPEVMTSSVTAPLEAQLGQMAGLDQMSSQSSSGASVITLRFSLDTRIDIAEQEVQAAINNAGSLLPSDLPAPPIYARTNPADAPVFTFGVTSKNLPLTEVQDIITVRLAQKLSQIPGVGVVSMAGGNRKAYRIEVNIPKLTSFGIALDTLRTIIGTINVNAPTGSFEGPRYATSLRFDGQISSAEQLLKQVIAYKDSGPVRLEDVANVSQAPENDQLAAWANDQTALIVNVQRQPGANILNVVSRLKKRLPALEKDLPPGVQIIPLTDRTTTIRASVEDVTFELLMAIMLVVSIIFIFLRSIQATLIPSLSVPLSLIGTLGAMYLLDYSLDNLSLMALAVASGFVVDDAIVVIENTARFLEAGESPLTAALKGAQEIGFTIISLTVSLIAVLIPLLFMQDILGRLFHEFAMTLASAVAISAFIAITLVPMMCARLLKPASNTPANPVPGRIQRLTIKLGLFSERAQQGLLDFYAQGLDWALKHQRFTLTSALTCFFLTFWLGWIIPKGFFPAQDTGLIQAVTAMSPTISFEGMKKRQKEVADRLLQDPDVRNLSSFIGVDGQNMTLNNGRMLITLTEKKGRGRTLNNVLDRLDHRLSTLPGIRVYLRPVEDISLNTSFSALENQFILETPDYDSFRKWVPVFMEALKKRPELGDVASDLQADGEQLTLHLDRPTGARYAITPQTVDNLLYDSFGQRQVSTIYSQSNQYRVILEAAKNLKTGEDGLRQLYLPGISGNSGQSSNGPARQPTSGLVPLLQVVKTEKSAAPLVISHSSQFPATIISFNPAPGASLGHVIRAVEDTARKIRLPASFRASFQGTAAAFQGSLEQEAALIAAAVVAVYIVLGVLYESFIHPITILSTLPSAAIGALLGLYLAGMPLDVMGIIGIVLLIGIVKKNAIMMIDFALIGERRKHLSPPAAIREAALLRFRPILMTTLAALFGALPLMLGTGTGSELRRPLGVAIVCGLIFSQMLTIFTTPVIYLFMERLSQSLRRGILSLRQTL